MAAKKKFGKSWKKAIATGVINVEVPKEPQDVKTLTQLQRELDLASARLTYAIEQERYWKQEAGKRSTEFDEVNTRYKQQLHGFTDEEIRDNPKTSSVWSWAYAK